MTQLSKREEFAKAAMVGLLASDVYSEKNTQLWTADEVADLAVIQADALIKRLEVKPDELSE